MVELKNTLKYSKSELAYISVCSLEKAEEVQSTKRENCVTWPAHNTDFLILSFVILLQSSCMSNLPKHLSTFC